VAKSKHPGPQATLSFAVNGHALRGEKWPGTGWTFQCSFPGVADRHRGAGDATAAVAEFMGLALGSAVAATIADAAGVN
jgi:hypothetical protein